jgi:hypothetical protein
VDFTFSTIMSKSIPQVNTEQEAARLAGPNHHRRWFLAATAGAGVAAVAVGARTTWLDDARGSAEYEEAIRAIWRHADSTELPWPAAQRELIRYATLAANAHNSQPWRFRLVERRILVVPDFRANGPAGDYDGHELFASLGCAVENIVQAADAFGFQATPSFDAATGNIAIDFVTAARRGSILFEAIPRRLSTRAEFDGRRLAPADLRLLELSGSSDGVKVLLFTEPRQLDRILSCVVEATSMQMDDLGFVRELRSWIRVNYREALATRDGLFVKLFGHRVMPEPIASAMVRMSLTSGAQTRTCERQIRSAAGVAVFVSERNDPIHWIEAGRCSQRFALQATALGISTSFISQATAVPTMRDRLATDLGVGARRPDVMMRFGYGPAGPRSLRRPIDQVMLSA